MNKNLLGLIGLAEALFAHSITPPDFGPMAGGIQSNYGFYAYFILHGKKNQRQLRKRRRQSKWLKG